MNNDMANPSAPLIAIIEDEAPIQKFLHASLQVEGFRIIQATTAKEGVRLITQEHPAIVLLDLGLPDADGINVISSVRGWSSLPIIVLSARGEEKSKIEALDAGADDYLTKPFGVGELLARIRSALRRAARPPGDGEDHTFRFGNVHGDLAARQVFVDENEVKLTKLEFDLLALLIRNRDRVLTHQYLLKEVWGLVQQTSRTTCASSWPPFARSWKRIPVVHSTFSPNKGSVIDCEFRISSSMPE